MRKFYSEAFEAMYDEFLNDFETGRITEAEFREFEADAFIDEPVADGEANEIYGCPAGTGLTQEEQAMLEEAEKHPIKYDEDSPNAKVVMKV